MGNGISVVWGEVERQHCFVPLRTEFFIYHRGNLFQYSTSCNTLKALQCAFI
jgi:hypothetical protein